MKVMQTKLEGVCIIEPNVFEDSRGLFMEAWHHQKYEKAGIPDLFVQDNISHSRRGVLRGIHFQNPGEQGKLVSVLRGSVFDVAVDLRADSPTFKQWVGIELSSENCRQLFVPPGFGHGFSVTSEDAIFLYKCTDYYRPEYEHSLRWDDPELGIEWPDRSPVISPKDATAPFLRDLGATALPRVR